MMRFYRIDSQNWQLILPGLVISKGKGSGWVRLFGRTVKAIDARRGWVPFSIRENIVRSWRLGPFIVTGG